MLEAEDIIDIIRSSIHPGVTVKQILTETANCFEQKEADLANEYIEKLDTDNNQIMSVLPDILLDEIKSCVLMNKVFKSNHSIIWSLVKNFGHYKVYDPDDPDDALTITPSLLFQQNHPFWEQVKRVQKSKVVVTTAAMDEPKPEPRESEEDILAKIFDNEF